MTTTKDSKATVKAIEVILKAAGCVASKKRNKYERTAGFVVEAVTGRVLVSFDADDLRRSAAKMERIAAEYARYAEVLTAAGYAFIRVEYGIEITG